MGKLTPDETRFYRENGYFLYKKQLFSPEKLNRLESLYEEKIAKKEDLPHWPHWDVPHFEDERFFEFLLSDEVLDLVESVIGPNIALWSSGFICKDPMDGKKTPWHEDSSYWKGRLSGFDIVTVWLALDQTKVSNGAMGVIPGSHLNGFSEYEEVSYSNNIFGAQIKGLDPSKAVYFEMEKGECSLHHACIIHGGPGNESPNRRNGYTMRYFPTHLKFHEDFKDNRGFKIWLARGKDLAGNRYQNA